MTEFVVNKIVDRRLTADNEVSITFETVKQKKITLRTHPLLAADFVDHLAALHDEALVAGRQRTGLHAGAYRTAQNVLVRIDATASTVLLDFDPEAAHRVGVAVSIDRAEAFAKTVLQWVEKAKLQDRSQKPQ